MPLEFLGRAPYAPATTITAILDKHRSVPLTKVDATTLDLKVKVPESLIPRTISAMNMLGFTDDEGNPTQEFVNLARVPEADFKPTVAEMLRTAYAPVFADLGGDPASASPEQIKDAFRSYTPVGQVDRMAQLFSGLMTYVGLAAEGPRRRVSKSDNGVKRTVSGGATTVKEDRKVKIIPPTAPYADVPSTAAYSQSVRLSGGAGTITLSGTVNPFALKGESRDFVFAMIDLMDEYNTKVAGGEHA